MDVKLLARFEQAVREDGRYALEAFEFLHRGLDAAARVKYGAQAGTQRPQHVTGQELCHALRHLAREMWGPLAHEVLRRWNIHTTRDFGEMVYLMISVGLFGRQESDELGDFDNVYDFDEAFGSYEITLDSDDE